MEKLLNIAFALIGRRSVFRALGLLPMRMRLNLNLMTKDIWQDQQFLNDLVRILMRWG